MVAGSFAVFVRTFDYTSRALLSNRRLPLDGFLR